MTSKVSIVALAASPEKGMNSDTLLEAFLEGIKEVLPMADVDKYYTMDLVLAPYCHECSNEPQKDEKVFSELVQKLQKAQGVVVGTPTYNFNVPSGLKNLIDRIGFMSLDYRKKNILGQPPGKLGHLKTYFIVSGGTPSSIHRFIFFLYPGFWLRVAFTYYYAKHGGSFYGGGLTFRNQAKDQPKLLKKMKNKGRRYGKKLKARSER